MRTLPLAVLFCLAGCGPSDPGVEAAPAAARAEAVAVREPASSAPAVPVRQTATPEAGVPEPGAGVSVAALAGRWRVTGVEVAPGPVSAVDVDDANLMGAILAIAPERLAWEPHQGGFFTDTCPDPQIDPNGHVRCGEGQFGPPDMAIARADGRLRLQWYDGAILLLSRVG